MNSSPAEVSGFAPVPGGRLYYEVAGHGRPLVMIHGFTLDCRMWDEQFESFASRCRVIRYDARGFGKSDLPTDREYSHVDDLSALLEFLGVSSADVVGLSMGGAIAAEFALAHPDLTHGLVFVDSALGGYTFSPESDALEDAIFTRGRNEGAEAAKRMWLAHPLFASANEQPHVRTALEAIVSAYSGFHFTHHDPQRAGVPSAMGRLDQIAAPTLVIVGERDLPDFRAIGRILAQRIPRARLVTLPGAGHMSNMEAPVRFNRAVMEFLKEVDSRTPAKG